MSLDSLPYEILREILSYRAHKRKDLRSCSLASHNLWAAATSILYSNIDLSIKTEHDKLYGKWRLTKRKEVALIQALASNPKLGAKVRTLSIFFPSPNWQVRDEYMTFGRDNGDQAARNMSLLIKAVLTDSGLTRHIIANITAYPQLTELGLRLGPEPHQWSNKPTQLKKLKWEVPTDHFEDGGTIDSWNTVANVLDIAGSVFPEIVELDIFNCRRELSDAAPDSLSHGITEHRQAVLLPRLQSFRYQGKIRGIERELMLDFVRRNHDTLTSLAIPFDFKTLNQKMMECVLQVVTAAPKLKSLTVIDDVEERWESHTLPEWSDGAPPPAGSTYGLEFFEMWNIRCPFSPAIGQFLSGWSSLRVLKIGAPLYGGHPPDGRPHFEDVAPEIQSFVGSLPRSIEEIYIELENDRLVCDEDTDFDPIEKLSTEIFKSLPRLHTLDVNAWIGNIDMGLGYLPETAIFCRRRPSEQDPDNKKKKAIWTSRLQCLYQEDYASLRNTTIELEGDFEGEDADEPWLGGRRSWVSQKAHHWENGKHFLIEETNDPNDPNICYDPDDIYFYDDKDDDEEEEDEDEDDEGSVDLENTDSD